MFAFHYFFVINWFVFFSFFSLLVLILYSCECVSVCNLCKILLFVLFSLRTNAKNPKYIVLFAIVLLNHYLNVYIYISSGTDQLYLFSRLFFLFILIHSLVLSLFCCCYNSAASRMGASNDWILEYNDLILVGCNVFHRVICECMFCYCFRTFSFS